MRGNHRVSLPGGTRGLAGTKAVVCYLCFLWTPLSKAVGLGHSLLPGTGA